jgi:hypothetical protein
MYFAITTTPVPGHRPYDLGGQYAPAASSGKYAQVTARAEDGS